MKKILNDNYKSIIYISHPYNGDKANEEEVSFIINELQKQYPDYLFVSPIHSFSFAYNQVDYKTGIDMCFWLLEKCDEMWVYGDFLNSKGCTMEIEYCKTFGIPYCIKL